MNLKVTGKSLKITDGIRSHLDCKINKIFHDSDENTSIHVLLRIEKYRHIAEVTFKTNGHMEHTTDETGNLYTSIDGVLKKIETRLKKNKERTKDLKIKSGLEIKSMMDA